MEAYSTLDLTLRCRPGERYSDGAWKTERSFLDFVVDGHSLYDMLVLSRRYDLISGLWLGSQALVPATQTVSRLLLLEPSDFPDDRRSLYVCPECGDLGCGAISIVVDCDADSVAWRNFGYENNYEPRALTSGFEDVGPFVFGYKEYETALEGALRTLRTEGGWKPHEIERGWRREDLYTRGRPH